MHACVRTYSSKHLAQGRVYGHSDGHLSGMLGMHHMNINSLIELDRPRIPEIGPQPGAWEACSLSKKR